MKAYLLLLVLPFHFFAQNINHYKSVVVPAKFETFKKDNPYNLGTYSKLLFEKYGFEVYNDDSTLPTAIATNRCNSLTAGIIDESNLFSTKLKIVLKDCKDNVVYESESGSSKEKSFDKAYLIAFREAAKSFESMHYKYAEATPIPTGFTTTEKLEVEEPAQKELASTSSSNPDKTYFAQPTANGYQVLDSENKVVIRLFNTSQKDVFMASKGEVQGTLLTKNGKWFFEYYEGAKLISEPINLKF